MLLINYLLSCAKEVVNDFLAQEICEFLFLQKKNMNSIIKAFAEVAPEYDKQRMDLIPCFNDFYGTMVFLMETEKKKINILDLGAGTGLLTFFAHEKFPEASFTLIDVSSDMLNLARARFKGMPNFAYLEANYSTFDFGGGFDMVVSSLSVHHLEKQEKINLFKKIYKALNPGGCFINGDLFLARTESSESFIHNVWVDRIKSGNLSVQEQNAAYERMKLDKPDTVQETLGWLDEIGFADVELFYKYFNFGVVRGKKL